MNTATTDNGIANMVRDFCLIEGYKFHNDYSGRCMFGRKCIGIEHNETTAKVSVRLARHIMEYYDDSCETDAILRCLENARQDNLGLHTITYWPYIEGGSSEEK